MATAPTVKAVPRIVKLALTGCLAGGLVSLAGCHWLLWSHDEEEFEFCDESYADCIDDAVSERDKQWCEDDVRLCYEACEGQWEADAEDDAQADDADDDAEDGNDDASDEASEGNDDDEPPRTEESGESDEGEGEEDEGEGETGEDPGVCIDLFSNCLDNAQTLQDVEACEVLFDHCVNPGECPDCGGCPVEALEACLANYESCASLADTPEKVEACGASFDECTAPFAYECQVEENPNLEPCLEQHELCVACAGDDEQLAACQTVFESCVGGY